MFEREHYPVAIVGGGQAGLSASACLSARGVPHVVIERARVAEAWRSQRWDSFCLVTPNWQCALPGFHYAREHGGTDPDGFMLRDEIVAYVELFRDHIAAPVVEGVSVDRLTRRGEGYALETSAGPLTADAVVVATGGYHRPKIPAASAALPGRILQLHSSTYRNPAQCPEGAVLVVGTGQSGCQIAEDLHLEGREVHLAVGGAPRSPRVYRGRDVTAWLVDMGHFKVTVDDHPLGRDVRRKANHYLSGRGGGREIDLRRFALEGMRLHGRFAGVGDGAFHFRGDLANNLDAADAGAEKIKREIDFFIRRNGIEAPPEPPYRRPWSPPDPFLEPPQPLSAPLERFSTVIWCTGFSTDWRWIELDVFEKSGYPIHCRGLTPAPGLCFLGLPWMHTWGSGRFSGVADDAEHVTAAITARLAAHAAP